jgi:hypothetical protein
MCVLRNIEIGDRAELASRTSVPWIAVYMDQLPGTTPCFSNIFENIRMTHFVYRGWSQFRDDYAAATGNVYSNIYIGGGNNTGVSDLSTVDGSAIYVGSLGQSVFNQINVEWLASRTPIHFEVCGQCVFNSFNIEGVTLKAGSLQSMGLITWYLGDAVWNGLTVNNCSFNTADNVQDPSIFRLASSTRISMNAGRNMFSNKTASDLVLFRTINPAGETETHVDLQHWNFEDEEMDRVDGLVLSDDGAGFGLISDYNNSTPLVLANASVTHYAGNTPGNLIMTPTGSTKTITLARAFSAARVARIPRGTRRRVYNAATSGVINVAVNNYNAAPLHSGITFGTSAEFAFDGTDWVRVA